MQVPKHIFRSYDIRGLVEEEITVELARAIGRGFATWLSQKEGKSDLRIAVGRDMRASSLAYQSALMQGLVESGVRVFDIGLVSTPAFYFSVGDMEADGGIMVSASHNPASDNGFKFTRAKALPVGGQTGFDEIIKLIEAEAFLAPTSRGSVEKIDGAAERAAKNEIAFAGAGQMRPFKIVADSGNGMGAQYLDVLFRAFSFDVERMFWDFDGTFPNHEADPFKEENLVMLQKKVVELGADLGIATDGDGDRIFFVDEKGKTVEPAIVRGIIAQVMLRRHPGATICYDIRPGKITKDMILEAGGVPSVTIVGHSHIKKQMSEVGAVFGGESSGHFFYRFQQGIFEGPTTVAIQLLRELSVSGKTFSEFLTPLRRYAHSGEINFRVANKEATLARVKDAYVNGEIEESDGVSVTFPDFWFNLRPSNTESKIRLNLEAVDQATMERRRDEVIALIQG